MQTILRKFITNGKIIFWILELAFYQRIYQPVQYILQKQNLGQQKKED